ncbi:MAG TPA: 3' terminal RNA ribose 2'-O-methyltransferase Hen1, partial [Ktedonobacterales bacterium]|nr:3' terminal RNA ribose 2'-O-methyltransferase Hen1 [Ktedonobacterales bacterium]
MLLTLACTAPDAPDLGHLLQKHPDSVFERPCSAGKVWVFYPEVTQERVTVALLVEVDPVGLVRGPAALAGLDQYVNDRPYVASSLVSVALNVAFSTAMAGRSKQKTERFAEHMRWRITLPAVACDAGEKLITSVFAPLGYTVVTARLPLDPQFPAWGQADLYAVALEGEQTVPDVLNHLYVLLPVLDNTKHYYVAEDEIDKLLDRGGTWLAAHPERELIARRYLRYKRPFVASALERLAEADATGEAKEDEDAVPTVEEVAEHALGLHEQRLHAVMEAVRESGAASLADLGCGEGRLLSMALKEPGLNRIFGMDVSSVALARARRRLHVDRLAPAQQRVKIAQGSLLYRDRRLEGFDAAALIEVIEHLDAPRLEAMERVVFAHARPRRVVVTTPNREYNVHWKALGAEKLRHADHRFEWTRSECQAWAERVAATYGYAAERRELGPIDEQLGGPSQMVVF